VPLSRRIVLKLCSKFEGKGKEWDEKGRKQRRFKFITLSFGNE
jgi:hypothetical protein